MQVLHPVFKRNKLNLTLNLTFMISNIVEQLEIKLCECIIINNIMRISLRLAQVSNHAGLFDVK